MSIDGCGVLRRRWRLEALRDKIENRRDLLPRYVELLHHLFDAQILQILDDCSNGQPGVPKHPRAADLTGHAFHSGALRPVERGSCHNPDRKSTRLNSSHLGISYAVFCLKKTSTLGVSQ